MMTMETIMSTLEKTLLDDDRIASIKKDLTAALKTKEDDLDDLGPPGG